MKEARILGLDLGTNSIGWAIVDYYPDKTKNRYKLIDCGVIVFPEGVKREYQKEMSRAAERTIKRGIRKSLRRKKSRMVDLIRILLDNQFCPNNITRKELRIWRRDGICPTNEEFRAWLLTDDKVLYGNPYYCRNLCLSEKLDLGDIKQGLTEEQQKNRLILGRALYHINERRGFKSNRREETKPSNGEVNTGITNLQTEMKERGFEYLGQYFYSLYNKSKREKIRGKYTSRADYEKEVLRICEVQGLDEELTEMIRHTIIDQRKLKSQRQNVGRDKFGTHKKCCPISHPLFEQYRMYQLLNQIQMCGPYDNDMRLLTEEEKSLIIPLFLDKEKITFNFEEIAKILSKGNKDFGNEHDKESHQYKFNYYMDASITGCPTITQLSDVFGVKGDIDEWLDRACEVYTLSKGKTKYEVMNDIWHAIFFSKDCDNGKVKLREWGKDKLQLSDDDAEKFSDITLSVGYSDLSLKVIRQLLPYMKECGTGFNHAAFMGKLSSVLLSDEDKDGLFPTVLTDNVKDIEETIEEFHQKRKNKTTEIKTVEEYIRSHIESAYNLTDKDRKKMRNLYDPSSVATSPRVKVKNDEIPQLGSPRTGSLRNPMAMRTLFYLRKLVNELLKKQMIDQDTIVREEYARGLNTANMRAAIYEEQRANEKINKECAAAIKELGIQQPTERDYRLYQLWKEQGEICIYTGKPIPPHKLFNEDIVEIDHIVPRSRGGDSTKANEVVCYKEANDKKGDNLPSEMSDEDKNKYQPLVDIFEQRYLTAEKNLKRINTHGIVDPDKKNKMIQKRHRLTMERDYWRDKYKRFTMTEIRPDFLRRQGADNGVIAKYARKYLQSFFRNVSTVKSVATAEFRMLWGLQGEYEKKDRSNHCHHAIDAIVIACIGDSEYQNFAKWRKIYDNNKRGISKQEIYKPWKTFVEDIKRLKDKIFVVHYTDDNVPKMTKKRQRVNGRVVKGLIQGDTARVSLHKETNYALINVNGEEHYVHREPIEALADTSKEKEEANINKIVDPIVREKVLAAWKECGKDIKNIGKVWMNEDKEIDIRNVRVYDDSVKNPLQIRQGEHAVYVVNDYNYGVGLYKNERNKRKVLLVNSLTATKYYNDKRKGKSVEELFPAEMDGMKLDCVLKKGTMVLLYEKMKKGNNDNEKKNDVIERVSYNEWLKEKDGDKRAKMENDHYSNLRRLYKVEGIWLDGNSARISLVYAQEARASKDAKVNKGEFKVNGPFRPRINLSNTQFSALIEGKDFTIDVLGKVTFK